MGLRGIEAALLGDKQASGLGITAKQQLHRGVNRPPPRMAAAMIDDQYTVDLDG